MILAPGAYGISATSYLFNSKITPCVHWPNTDSTAMVVPGPSVTQAPPILAPEPLMTLDAA